jgi:uncharacterized protein
MMNIKLFKDYNLKGYNVIEAFPGAGLVGSMAGSYIIEKLGMEYIGYIESDLFPPIAAIHDGVPMFPARLYRDEKYKLLIVLSEFTVPSDLIYPLSMELLAFVRKYGISRIISISGMPSTKASSDLYIASQDNVMVKKANSAGIKPINEGVIAGISAILMVNAAQFKIPTLNLLVEVNPQIMDPKYAEIAIEGLNKIIGINIDLKDLEEEAKVVEARIRDLMKKMKASHDTYTNAAEATGPSMYA